MLSNEAGSGSLSKWKRLAAEGSGSMKANYHTHTQRCRHAQGTERDYVLAAIKAGISILGFSDHAPFPDYDYGLRMSYAELDDYTAAVDRLAREYHSDITLYKGLEIEYLSKYRPYYEELLTGKKLDYLILGEHFYPDARGELHNIFYPQGTEDYAAYARAIAAALKTGCFRIVAHPDIFALGRFAWDRNCDEASDIIIEAALRNGAILEYNANGLRRGIHDYPDGPRLMYPHQKFWDKVVGTGIPVIVGSDCHEAGQVWDDCLPAAREQLLRMGITPLDYVEGLGTRS